VSAYVQFSSFWRKGRQERRKRRAEPQHNRVGQFILVFLPFIPVIVRTDYDSDVSSTGCNLANAERPIGPIIAAPNIRYLHDIAQTVLRNALKSGQ